MEANETILQMKYARIIQQIAADMGISNVDAMDIFYNSRTFQLISEDVDDYYHYFHLVHDKYTDKVIDGLHLVFVELKKFKPQNFSEKKMQVLWLRFLTEINAKTLEAPAELLENPELNEALKIVEVAAYTPAEMRAYDKFWDVISRQKTIENDIWREANTKFLDTARKMKADGMTVELIAKYTGLTAEEIEGL